MARIGGILFRNGDEEMELCRLIYGGGDLWVAGMPFAWLMDS